MARPTDPNLRNPFTEGSTSPAVTHANANAAFLRDVRPGSAGDAGGNSNHDFSTDGQAHPFEDAHPDQTSMPTLPTQASRSKKFTIPSV